MRNNLDALMSSDKFDYGTPQKFFDELDEEFNFDIDLAASKRNAKCTLYLTKRENSLSRDWPRLLVKKNQGKITAWLNPPYGRELKLWIKKAYESTRNNNLVVVMLIPARTDTSYWHDYVMKAEDIRFIRGRLKFVGGKNSAPFPSAVIVFGKRYKKRKV